MAVWRLIPLERTLNSIQHICEFDKIPMYSTGKNCVFILKLFNKGTADEYDDMFTSGCNSIVCLNRWLNNNNKIFIYCTHTLQNGSADTSTGV